MQPSRAAHEAARTWLERVPDGETIGVLFSGGVDSGSVFLLKIGSDFFLSPKMKDG